MPLLPSLWSRSGSLPRRRPCGPPSPASSRAGAGARLTPAHRPWWSARFRLPAAPLPRRS
eukprot:7302322-Alexandrium_andersonii.AAC.1